jgi:C-terminal processing protease CtpA/Prc
MSILIFLCLNQILVIAQGSMPSREQRVFDLSLIWKEMQYNFVFSETLQKVNIDSLYLAYLPKVEQVTNLYEYFRVLNLFTAHFNDAHTRIYAIERPDVLPPLEVINFGERVIVSNVAKNLSDKIPIGSEIIKVNNISTVEFVKDSIFPYIGAATSHWKFSKSVNEMFYGIPQSTVNVTVKTPEGKENEVEMVRGKKEEMVDITPFAPMSIKIMNDNIGYIHFASCQPNYRQTIDSVFLSWIPQLRNCKGLIVDVRGNRGGSTQTWLMMAACLNDSVNNNGTHFSRKYIPTYKMWGASYEPYKKYYLGTAMEEIESYPIRTNIPDTMKLRQPLMVISDHFVGSATEWFLALMKESERATIIGSPSIGALTEPMLIPLSGSFQVMIAVKKYINQDGTDSNFTGVLPDIKVERDYEAYLQGKDNVLERAIEELLKKTDE